MKFLLFAFLITLNGCYCQYSPTYRAAVVEVNPNFYITNDFIDFFKALYGYYVDIIVFPEAVLNLPDSAYLMPNSTVFCDDPNAEPIFRMISCAARLYKMYVVVNIYTKIYCSMDDQSSCANKTDNTNTYNMDFAFDRNGATIAKYRKFNLFDEKVQRPEKRDFTTFQTDFNVKFGMFTCFDLQMKSPAIELVDAGISNFVYPTSWDMALPFSVATQFQQSWAYANNVNLLAANINLRMDHHRFTGSGIYAGRRTALQYFLSKAPESKILIADVPINLPPLDSTSDVVVYTPNMGRLPPTNINDTYDDIQQESLPNYMIEFLDFSKSLSYGDTKCHNDLCCNYNIEVTDNGSQDGKPSYSYAIAIFNGDYTYSQAPDLHMYRSICGLITCGEMNNRDSCGKQFTKDVHDRYTFKKLTLTMTPPTYREKSIMPNTVANNLYPLNGKEFELKTSKLNDSGKYNATLTLKAPKSDLLTFAIYARDYDKVPSK